jgi:hypothetical protein
MPNLVFVDVYERMLRDVGDDESCLLSTKYVEDEQQIVECYILIMYTMILF